MCVISAFYYHLVCLTSLTLHIHSQLQLLWICCFCYGHNGYFFCICNFRLCSFLPSDRLLAFYSLFSDIFRLGCYIFWRNYLVFRVFLFSEISSFLLLVFFYGRMPYRVYYVYLFLYQVSVLLLQHRSCIIFVSGIHRSFSAYGSYKYLHSHFIYLT